MINPFDPTGVIKAVFDYIWSLVTTILQNATTESLKGSIELLISAPWPNLSSAAFMTLWDSAFGFTLLFSFIILVLHAALTMIFTKHTSLATAVVGFMKNIATGAFMLVLVSGGILLVTVLMQVISLIIQKATGTADWAKILMVDHNYSGADAFVQFVTLNWTTAHSVMLYVEANLMSAALMLYLFWYLFAGVLGFGMFGRVVRSILLAGIVTQIFARVAQVAILGLGSGVSQIGTSWGFTPIVFALVTAFCSTAAVWVPFVMFPILSVRFYKHEKALDPRVIAEQLSKQRTREFSTNQLNAERADRAARLKSGAKEFGGEVLRVAAVTASIAGIAKLTSMILGAIPTPQTKLAAAAVAGIGIVSKAAQNKTSQAVSQRVTNRVSRPGRSTTPT